MLKINKIINHGVFVDDFLNLEENNKISLDKNFSIIYAPNGTGKSSLCRLFESENTDNFIEGELSNSHFSNGKEADFHVIHDQNSRNIIEGKTGEYIIGDNILEEERLKELINKQSQKFYADIRDYFNDKNINVVNHNGITEIKDNTIRKYVRSIVNVRQKGKDLDIEEVINTFDTTKQTKELSDSEIKDLKEYESLFVRNAQQTTLLSIIRQLEEEGITKNNDVLLLDELSHAVSTLEKYKYKDNVCVVCDDDKLLYEEKLNEKRELLKANKKSLDPEIKETLDELTVLLDEKKTGVFGIQETIRDAYSTGNTTNLQILVQTINNAQLNYNDEVENIFIDTIKKHNELLSNINQLNDLQKKEVEITEDDLIFITEIIHSHMNKNLHFRRDEKNNERLSIFLDDQALLGTDRRDLHLSTGEQNFISLAFEILKAKNTTSEVIVIDDPISSFDSIYKNKLVFLLIKCLKNKKTILFTHNLDLVHLMKTQHNGSFNMYIFNNIEGGTNGFIPISNNEVNNILYLDKSLDVFRKDKLCFQNIKNTKLNIVDETDLKLFLFSTLSFMRGYSKIIDLNYDNNRSMFSVLSSLMHGYYVDEIEEYDLIDLYYKVFGVKIKHLDSYIASYNDILRLVKNKTKKAQWEISNSVKIDDYPLLSQSLSHSFSFLYIRIKVENTLIKLFDYKIDKITFFGTLISETLNPNIKKNGNYLYSENERKLINDIRINFMSKKTLINNFNHYESSLNIFQPALDISDKNLTAEIKEIEQDLQRLEEAFG